MRPFIQKCLVAINKKLQNGSAEYTTFIMANSNFCIVAESMDEMIALTLTALSELAIWPNMS